MFRMLLKIYLVQFLFLLIFVACSLIAGEKNAPFWFVLITLSLTALTVGGAIARRGR
jgi:hypothetical protein